MLKCYRHKETGGRGIEHPEEDWLVVLFSGRIIEVDECEELHGLDALIPRGFMGSPGTKLIDKNGDIHTVTEVGLNTVWMENEEGGAQGPYSSKEIKKQFTLAGESKIPEPVKIGPDNWTNYRDKYVWVSDNLGFWLKRVIIHYRKGHLFPVKSLDDNGEITEWKHAYDTDPREWLKQREDSK